MGLKAFVTSLDDVPEAQRALYVRTEDGFILDIDDKEYRGKISEFRDNNIALKRQLDAAREAEKELEKLRATVQKYGDLDPEKAREAMSRIQEIEEQNLLDAGKMDEVIAQRTERMRQDYEGRLQALSKKHETTDGELKHFRSLYTNTVIEAGLQRAVSEVAAPRAGAMQDILARGRTVWSVDEQGNPVPRDAQGTVRYGKDGKEPITMKEWAEALVLDAPYLFEGSAGGGSTGSRGDNAGKRVSAGDQSALNNNIEAIAAGKVEVVR